MKILAKNRRATFDYDITERYVAGLSLLGTEVKSIKAGHVSLKGAFVAPHEGELFLIGTHVNPYPYAAANHEVERSRKLLLHKRELNTILRAIEQQGITAVPISIGLERGLVKLELGVGRGKRRIDKRELTKRRELAREADRAIKNTDRI